MTRRSFMLGILLGLFVLPIYAQDAATVYITIKGHTYHTHRECIALRTTKEPREMTLAQAKAAGLELCQICAHRKIKKVNGVV